MIARLRAVPASQWRYELLLLAVMLMEASLGACWFLLLNPWLGPHSAGAALAAVLSLMALAYLTTRLLLISGWPLRVQRGVALGVPILLLLVTLKVHVYAGRPWLSAFLSDWGALLSTPRGGPVAFFVFLICWQRGIALPYRDTSLWSVALGFRIGVLLVALAGFLWPADSQPWLRLIVAFFFFALIAIALARVDELATREPGADQPFTWSWGAVTLGAAILVVGLGCLFSQVYSAEGLGRLFNWLWPGLQAFGSRLRIVAEWVLSWLTPALEWIFRLLQNLLERLRLNWSAIDQLTVNEQGAPTPMPSQAGPASAIPWMDILRWTCIGVFIVLALLIVAATLRRRRQRSRPEAAAVKRATLPVGAWADDLLEGLRAGVERLADALDLGRGGMGRRLYAAISIRYIYVNVTRLAAQRGWPRPPATTPYEHLPALRSAFVGVDAELEQITEAYVGVHYGESPASLEELRRIRACWERVRGAGIPARRAPLI